MGQRNSMNGRTLQDVYCDVFEEGMIIFATSVRTKDLNLEKPTKPKPTVSHKISTTEPAFHVPSVSAGRPATQGKGWSESAVSAKRLKVDNWYAKKTFHALLMGKKTLL